jgi:chromosome segregation ATPase
MKTDIKIMKIIKTLRNLSFAAIAALSITSCQTKQIDALKVSKDSLQVILHERDSLLNDMIETFTQIETNLAFIKEQRNLISANSQNGETEISKKDQIIQDVQELAKLLQESKARLDDLNHKLKKSGIKIASLEKRVSELSDSLTTRNSEVISLTQELEKKNYEVGQLTEQLTNLESVKAEQEEVIKEQTSTIDNLNKAYYIIGTTKELKEKGLISKEGGFLGIGKTKTLNSDANNSYFTEIDVRQLSSIPLDAKEAKLLSKHPAGSFEFVTENEKITSLTIKNQTDFYKFTKYVVVETK